MRNGTATIKTKRKFEQEQERNTNEMYGCVSSKAQPVGLF